MPRGTLSGQIPGAVGGRVIMPPVTGRPREFYGEPDIVPVPPPPPPPPPEGEPKGPVYPAAPPKESWPRGWGIRPKAYYQTWYERGNPVAGYVSGWEWYQTGEGAPLDVSQQEAEIKRILGQVGLSEAQTAAVLAGLKKSPEDLQRVIAATGLDVAQQGLVMEQINTLRARTALETGPEAQAKMRAEIANLQKQSELLDAQIKALTKGKEGVDYFLYDAPLSPGMGTPEHPVDPNHIWKWKVDLATGARTPIAYIGRKPSFTGGRTTKPTGKVDPYGNVYVQDYEIDVYSGKEKPVGTPYPQYTEAPGGIAGYRGLRGEVISPMEVERMRAASEGVAVPGVTPEQLGALAAGQREQHAAGAALASGAHEKTLQVMRARATQMWPALTLQERAAMMDYLKTQGINTGFLTQQAMPAAGMPLPGTWARSSPGWYR